MSKSHFWYIWPKLTCQHYIDKNAIATYGPLCLSRSDILVDCPNMEDTRLKYFTVSSLKDLFEHVDNRSIIDFIKKKHIFIINCSICYLYFILYIELFLSSFSCVLIFVLFFFVQATSFNERNASLVAFQVM